MYLHRGLKFKQNIDTDLHFCIKWVNGENVKVICTKDSSSWEEIWEKRVIVNAFDTGEYVLILTEVEKEAYNRYRIISEDEWKSELFDTYEDYCLSQFNYRCTFIAGANFGVSLITGQTK